MKLDYTWDGARADLLAGVLDRRCDFLAPGHGIRAYRRHRSAIRVVLGDRGDAGGIDFWLFVSPDQRTDQRHFTGGIQRAGILRSRRAFRRIPGDFPACHDGGKYSDSDCGIQTGGPDSLHFGVGCDRLYGWRGRARGIEPKLGNLTGLRDRGTGQQHVLHRIWLTLTGGHVNPRALGIGVGTIVLVVLLRKVARRYHLPQIDMLVALIVAAIVAGWLRLVLSLGPEVRR